MMMGMTMAADVKNEMTSCNQLGQVWDVTVTMSTI